MKIDELRTAFRSQEPVKLNGITYDYVSGMIFRCKNNALVVSAELMDKTGRSVTVAPMERVERIESA